jgi:hypothetical protein
LLRPFRVRRVPVQEPPGVAAISPEVPQGLGPYNHRAGSADRVQVNGDLDGSYGSGAAS